MAEYFGPGWNAPALDDATQVATPVGQICGLCGTRIADGDRGWIRVHLARADDSGGLVATPSPTHAECEMFTVIGHELGVCHCTGWDDTRAAALEVWRRLMVSGADRG